jgi:hypothetical protein
MTTQAGGHNRMAHGLCLRIRFVCIHVLQAPAGMVKMEGADIATGGTTRLSSSFMG